MQFPWTFISFHIQRKLDYAAPHYLTNSNWVKQVSKQEIKIAHPPQIVSNTTYQRYKHILVPYEAI